jgi:hypothetical protein
MSTDKFSKWCVIDLGVRPADRSISTAEIDPADILGVLPQELLDLGGDLRVVLWDNDGTVIFTVNNFLSKTYKYTHGKIRFGAKHLQADQLRVVVGGLITCSDLNMLQSPALD